MPWRGAEYEGEFPSLGWALLDWMSEYLPSPRDPTQELKFTDRQAAVLLRWYAVHPITGEYLFRRGQSRRSKGVGKSPLEAAKAIAELRGDVVFDGWDANGEPVGRPWGTGNLALPYGQVAAVSEDQTDNTWSVVHYFLTENDGRAADALGIDAGLTRCFVKDKPGAKLEPVTASSGSRTGQPLTNAVLDETHLWTVRNGGVKLAATLRQNLTKMGGRSYETTNSFEPGEGSVAEATTKAAQRSGSIFIDAVEAPTYVDGFEVNEQSSDEVLGRALAVAYEDRWWIDIPRIVADMRDPDARWEDSCRFFLNWNRKGEGRAVDSKRWTELARPGDPPPAGSRIGLGFDGSISEDSTVLIGCHEGRSFVVAAWERPLGPSGQGWRVPRLEVTDAVRRAFATWDVGRMFGDPPKWWTELDAWAEEFRLPGRTDDERERVLALDTNQPTRFAKVVDRWLTGIAEGSHTHAGDELLTRHVLAAHKRKVRSTADDADQRTLYVIVKGEDGGKIDACIADILAFEAEATMPAARKRKPLAVFA